MASQQVLDFDAWREENQATTGKIAAGNPRIKVGGVFYELPPTLPATAALDVVRFKRAKGSDASVPATMLMNIGDSLFGEDLFREILNINKLDIDGMGALIMLAFKAYDDSEGGDTVPNRKTRRRRKPSTS